MNPAQGDLFTGRWTAHQKLERRRDYSGGLMPLPERIAHQEQVVRTLTAERDRFCGFAYGSEQAEAFRRAVINATAHLEKLRAELREAA